tara:strand:+ start:326 stop:1489 length:1164 start_codon:yes stop_codon:yes gene_type:complete
MAYYSIFPEIDSTLYSHPDRTLMNTGKDEILELVKERGSTNSRHYSSRILIKFKNEEIKSVISNTIGHIKWQDGTSKVNLQLITTEPKDITSILNIEAFAVSQSWHEGSGRYSNLPTSSNGVTWKYRDNSTTQSPWPTSSFQAGTTGSILSGSGLEKGGGSWYTGSGFTATQQFLNNDILDTNIDVTDIVGKWSGSLFNGDVYPYGINNNGFIIKQPDSVEENTSSSFGELQYFSVDTHTIYPPKLTFKWDDSSYITSSNATLLNNGELNVSLYRNKQEFNQNDEALLRINVRDKYPTRTFSTTSNYLNVGYFTKTSYYSIRDAYTEEEVIPFDDNFTKISADAEGMYFKIYMKGLQPERYYRILFKHINSDGTTIYDNDYYFKVVR